MKTFLSIGECMIEFSCDTRNNWHMGFAGDTLNTAWYARACFDADWEISYFTRLGKDANSARILNFLRDNGIDTQFTELDNKRQPGLYTIELDRGERSFAYWRDNSAARLLANNEELLAGGIEKSDLIYFSGITLAILAPDRRAFLLECVSNARKRGVITVFDPNIRPDLWEDAEIMRQTLMSAAASARIVLPSFDDEKNIFGDATLGDCAARYRQAGAEEVVVKNGGDAMLCLTPDGETRPVTSGKVTPVDTTGAGDAFNGAYLAARLTGLMPPDAAAKAHLLAMKVVQHHGALVPPSVLEI
jgi:2-dehydro-3-deoxygluconokinase